MGSEKINQFQTRKLKANIVYENTNIIEMTQTTNTVRQVPDLGHAHTYCGCVKHI